MTKSKNIYIGDVAIPLDTYAIGGTALLGIRASGKTYCAKGIAEQLLEHRVPIIVFDPIGVWRHLKVPATKGGKGYPVVVAGGRGADLLLTPQTATEIVRAAMRENIPLVVDLYDKSLSKADWRRIVQTCFRTLLYENEGVRHIFLEEAAEYVPQSIRASDGETYAEVEKLVRMGGNASLGITLINQRAQEVNKAVLDLCENLVLMRQMGAHAIDALEKWIDKVSPDFASEIAAGMPKMSAGEAWVFAGGAEKPIFTRSHAIRTYHPDRKNPDAKVVAAATDTSSFVAAMQRALPAIVEEQQANDPRKLKAEIARLTKLISSASNEAPKINTAVLDEQSRQITELMHDKRALEQHRDSVVAAFDRANEVCIKLFDHFAKAVEDARPLLSLPALAPFPALTKPSAPAPAPRAALRAPVAASAPRPTIGSTPSSLTKPQFAILRAFYWLQGEQITPQKVGFFADYSSKSGHFKNELGQLRSAGLVAGWAITAAGVAMMAPLAEQKPTGAELREWLRAKLDTPQNKFLDALVAAGGARLTNEDLERDTGYSATSGHFKNTIGSLRSIGAAEGTAREGGARAAAVFFE